MVVMLRRYIAAQIPGWIGTAIVLSALHVWLDLAPWISAAVVLVLLVKDIVLYPLTRHSYDPAPLPAEARMLGKTVVAERGLKPAYVRVDGELWNATLADDSGPLAPGGRGRVVALRGLTLLVEPESAE
jgi:membrane protein implicated in regulation of membrane protease activity